MKDYLIRATAANGQVRAFGVTSRELTETAKNAHDTSPVATAALGRLMSAAVMMGADLKGENDLLTLRMEGDGPMGGLLATSDSHGNVKGYAFHPEVLLPPNARGKLDVGGALGAGMLSVVKDIGLKEPYVGQTNLVSGEIAEDLTYYYATSEQIPCSIALGVLMNKDNTVRQAGGFMIQLLPGASDELIDRLEERLGELPSITALLDAGKTPEEILSGLLGDFDLEILEKKPVQFHCDCSRERVERAIVSIGEKEIREMIEEGKPIEAGCQFCNKKYSFSVEELEELLQKAVRP